MALAVGRRGTAGAKHSPGIKRFQRGVAPVYVLDLVVESETVAR